MNRRNFVRTMGGLAAACVTVTRRVEARGFDKMRSIVEVDLKDGRKLGQPSDERYRGGPERPFTREELHQKFADCAGLFLSADQIRHALDTIESLERVASIRDLIKALSPA